MKPENPAKSFLRRYRAAAARVESLQRVIDTAYDRAYSCTSRLKPIVVDGSRAYDRMAEDVAKITDTEELLRQAQTDAFAILDEVLEAIRAVPDELQKAVLTMRYVEGASWPSIQDRLGYERTQAYVIHGWALQRVNRWLQEKVRTKTDYLTCYNETVKERP